MKDRTLLVVGASGLLGRAAVEHFRDLPGWYVIGMSRRRCDVEGVTHLEADLLHPETLEPHRPALASVTHILYAALFEMEDLIAGWRHREQMATNLAMFRNLLAVVEEQASGLTHVNLLQGTKAYGIHVEPMAAPAKEYWARHAHENFYWLQEDHLLECQRGKAWSYTIWRPQAVFGHAVGSPMNLLTAIGVHAALCRERGDRCSYPDGAPITTEATDARLLARGVEWAADCAAAADQTFNITNGDVLLWPNLWPAVCRHFKVEEGEPTPSSFSELMPQREPEWAALVEKHGLLRNTLAELVGGSWQFLDRAMRAGGVAMSPSIVSTIKIRQAGFADCFDTEDTLSYWFTRMQEARLLPQ
ncbi:MAG: hypothetical protein CMM47_04365 [Rhodospirillaceae bacterium]|mgnify:CR=1 FL=1|nr:hypothetical protein [Rhodospirillaceae bacterium]